MEDIRRDYPILEFDADRQAMLEPHKLAQPINIPTKAVACFFQDVISTLVTEYGARQCYELESELGNFPVYELDYQGESLAVFHPGVGAPLAAGFLEEMIAVGARTFMACGGAGVLDASIQVGEVIVPFAAVRDEGVSYPLSPSGARGPGRPQGRCDHPAGIGAPSCALYSDQNLDDGCFLPRDGGEIRLRKEEGCKAVEMEAASFFAVAQFRECDLRATPLWW